MIKICKVGSKVSRLKLLTRTELKSESNVKEEEEERRRGRVRE